MRFKTEAVLFVCVFLLLEAISLKTYAAMVQRTQLNMSLDQYLNAPNSSQSSDALIQASVNYMRPTILGSYLVGDADLIWSGNEDSFFYNIKNLNLTFGQAQNIIVGVHKESWNPGLEFWSSTEWNPQLQRNRLRVQEGGMPGVFYKHQDRSWQMTLMYSPYMLPAMGPDYDFKNGQVNSQNPWFLAPPESVPYEGKNFQTNYSLNEPSLSDFLQEAAYVAALDVRINDRMKLRFNWANKASSHILLDLNFMANASQPDVPIDVLVKPRLARHELRSLEATWNSDQNTVWRVSFLQEVFDSQNFDTQQFTYQVFDDQNVLAMMWEKSFYSYDLSLGVLWRDGGDLNAVGELSSALVNQSLRNIYERAVQGSLRLKKLWHWDAVGSVVYDWKQQGVVASLNLRRSLKQNAFFELGVDGIEPFNNAEESGFIYQYRNLDRVWAGVGYVF